MAVRTGDLRLGVAAAVFAFVAWGLLPVYWKGLAAIPPVEILAHRIVWTVLFAAIVLAATRRFREIAAILASRRACVACLGAGLLLGANWLIFIGAVNSGRVFECSLGYFLNPLSNVLLGYLLLGERFRPWQKAAIAAVAIGVLVLALGGDGFPWISLVLALTFACYGVIRKTARYESLPGLFLESAVLLPLALAYLAWVGLDVWSTEERSQGGLFAWLAASGVITALPLLAFTFAARRLRLSTLGFIQYLGPTCMLALSVLVYDEAVATRQWVALGWIWVGLAIFSLDSLRAAEQSRTATLK